MACREGTLEAGRGGRSRRREAKGGAYEEIAKLWQAKDTCLELLSVRGAAPADFLPGCYIVHLGRL